MKTFIRNAPMYNYCRLLDSGNKNKGFKILETLTAVVARPVGFEPAAS